ncbi:ABC transporter permease [Methylophaga sp. UBA2689]|jgi:iron(III) transport system permease protein|uniref:ABC transporter permease n=2 Tax=Methylophaga TaxID=40222 RepID=UPI0039C9C2BA
MSFIIQFRPYPAFIFVLAVALSMPVAVVLAHVFVPSGDIWQHLSSTVLPDYIRNSLLLMFGVAIGTLLIGVTAAWLTTMCQFPGRSVFEWALLLPMAMPAYIIAYTYTGMLDFAGPLQTSLREWFGWQYGDYWFPQIRSLNGAVAMLTLVLYPYVYLLSRAAFLNQSICVLDVSRTLGNGPWKTFWKVALPLARPAIIAGLSLALMETLADYGTVQFFGVSTFTTGIFRTWFGMGSAAAAAQLAAGLMVFVFALILIERYSRRKARYHHTSRRHQDLRRFQLTGGRAFLALLFCLFILGLGFLLPAFQLLSWTINVADTVIDAEFLRLLVNSLSLAAFAAVLALLLALVMAYAQRLYPGKLVSGAVRVAGMGYAVPGAVIAVGVMIPFAWIDNTIDDLARSQFNYSTGLLLSGTLVAVTFAYLTRFLAVSLQTVDSGLTRITHSMDEAGRSFGFRPLQILRQIHIPMLSASLMTALLLVFVDVLKELPATLILRPFNFNTLAVKAYELASDERLAEAAPAALAIVIVGIIPVILLSKTITRSRKLKLAIDEN